MKSAPLAAQARVRLDERFTEMRPVARFMPPTHGWIKGIREALGISAVLLGKRLGISQPSVVAMEQSESLGTIQLATLRRVAEALDCTLVYALVPNQPLEETVRERARQYIRRHLVPVQHSMLLEDQRVAARDVGARLEEVLRATNPRKFWE
jgi:predicted DNA-binding mobile mystery protein A